MITCPGSLNHRIAYFIPLKTGTTSGADFSLVLVICGQGYKRSPDAAYLQVQTPARFALVVSGGILSDYDRDLPSRHHASNHGAFPGHRPSELTHRQRRCLGFGTA